ncbi:MAG TPA: Wzz/FepE/Etk N-terminal domain-containing protein [Candidatus Solibacter sp.]|nr:Wzz/FepE/Etk N-terminal domain-containing protein [Candidatus Solibacter sp.]
MIENRELTIDDYLAMLRRRAKVILIPALLAPLTAYMVSYFFPAKYTSQSLVLVEGQKVPENMVQPVVSQDLTMRVATLQQQVMSQSQLQPVVEKLYPNLGPAGVNRIIDSIQANMNLEPVVTSLSAIGTSAGKPPKPGQSPVPGFYISYTASKAREAQQICNELTTLMVSQNLHSIQDAAAGTSAVLGHGLDDAKRNLDDMDAKLAAFKKEHVGQLPDDEENNFKILTGLNTQLEANTQQLNRAQADKSYAESMLAQQLGAWKALQSSTNPQTLEKQLSEMQSQLVQLEAKYTEDHPDVIKLKADIAGVRKKLAEINNAPADASQGTDEKASAMEPAEIRQLRLQIHQYGELIAAATRDQKRLQTEIATYQSRVSLSPAVEEQYKELTRDYSIALKGYQDLLAKKNTADLTVKMNNQEEGERMFPLNPANLPDSPSFPNRLFFAGGGLGAGLGFGLALALWMEFRDKSIRNEADAEAALDLPMLVSVPWLGAEEEAKNGFWHRDHKPDLEKDALKI